MRCSAQPRPASPYALPCHAPRFARLYEFRIHDTGQPLPADVLRDPDQRDTLTTIMGLHEWLHSPETFTPTALLVLGMAGRVAGLSGAHVARFLQAAHQALCADLGLLPQNTPPAALEGAIGRVSHDRRLQALEAAYERLCAQEAALPLRVTI